MPTHPTFEEWYAEYEKAVLRVVPKFTTDKATERIAYQYNLTPNDSALATISGEYEKLRRSADVRSGINGRKLQSGLNKFRDGIEMLREACDEIRMSGSASTGDTYNLIELGTTMCIQMTGVMWQFYERLRTKFR